ncbi:MAG: tetratricopeptide repeat protein [Nitrospiraceae bacterium]|nr:tetratricopeptide repeat protein [Nitrospiraceae bacterium]
MRASALLLGVLAWPAVTPAETQQILEGSIRAVLAEQAGRQPNVNALVRLADLHLDLGDERTDPATRKAAYDEGAKYAKQALEREERNAQAHYLYAANTGSAAQLKGMMASALTVADLKAHVRRALEIQPNHAPSLHMMGMMLEELPWFMGGDAQAAVTYLKQATAADPSYAHARLDLARVYVKRQDFAEARKELLTMLQSAPSMPQTDSDRRHRQEASALLASLPKP